MNEAGLLTHIVRCSSVATRRPGPHQMSHARTHARIVYRETQQRSSRRRRRSRRVNELHVVMHTIHASARTQTCDCGNHGRGGGGSHLAAEAIIWEPPRWASSVACPLSLENGHVDFAATGYRCSGNAGRNFQDSLSCHRRFLLYEPERLLLSRPP